MPMAVLIALGGGALSALCYLSLTDGSVAALALAYVTPLPLFAVGLSLGFGAIALAAATATLVVSAVGQSLPLTAVFLAMDALPAAFVVRQALLSRYADDGRRQWYPPGPLLVALSGCGLAAFAVAVAMTPDSLEATIRSAFTASLGALLGPSSNDPAGALAIIAPLASVLPGLAVASWLVMLIVNGALAQRLVRLMGRNQRPTPHMAEIEVPEWVPMALAASGIAAALGSGLVSFVALNAAIILALPPFSPGLASSTHLPGRAVSRSCCSPCSTGRWCCSPGSPSRWSASGS